LCVNALPRPAGDKQRKGLGAKENHSSFAALSQGASGVKHSHLYVFGRCTGKSVLINAVLHRCCAREGCVKTIVRKRLFKDGCVQTSGLVGLDG